MSPVLRPISTSVSASGTGLKPFSLNHRTMPSSPADVKSLALRRSLRLWMARAEKM